MKRFVIATVLVAVLLLLCCCADGITEQSEDTIAESEESIQSVDATSEERSVEISVSSEESLVVTSEETSEEISEAISVAPPVQSQAPSKEPETIPKLILGPQPEGEYHTLAVGEKLQLYSQIEGSELEDAMLKWEVSDRSVVALSGKCVTALSPGTATVTLSYSNGLMPVSIKFMVVPAEE